MDTASRVPQMLLNSAPEQPAEIKALQSTTQPPNNQSDLRSMVANRFMHMLRSHDRARLELLAAQPTEPR